MSFKSHLETFLDDREVNLLLTSLENENFTSFRLNTLKVGELSQILNENLFKEHKYVKKGYYYDKANYQLGKNILFEAGAYYIQEPAAMLAVELLNPMPGDKVLDMCAAPGGKSFHAINLMNDSGLLVCNDLNTLRAHILSSNIEKTGAKNVLVLNDDSKKYKKDFIEYFDKIILDAPCSGSGMFRKNDFARQDWSISKVLECQKIQMDLLSDAYDMLKGQGTILYSTCSYSKEENEDVIIDFLNKHSDCSLIQIPLKDDFYPSIGINGAIRLHPSHYKGEGHFISLIKKNSNTEDKNRELIKKNKPVNKLVLEFLKNIGFEYKKEKILNFNENYYYADFDLFKLDKIKFLRYGLHLGEFSNNRFIPSHSLAMYHLHSEKNFIELNEEEAKKYIAGETIAKDGNQGYKIVTYKKLPLGFVKHVNNVLKNHYPKGLRKRL